LPAVPPVGIVGAGRAGLALAVALRRVRVPVVGVHARRERPVPAGVKLTWGGAPPWLGEVGVVIVAVSDDGLWSCAAELARAGTLGLGQTALHLSGALTHDVLAPLGSLGVATGSMHPMAALGPEPVAASRRFRGATFALEGDLAAVGVADAVVRRLHGVPITLAPELKAVYHAGAVFASNYVVTMIAVAARLLEQAGVAPDAALPGLLALARGTVDDIEARGPAGALTGPAARGDLATIRHHLAALAHGDAELYRAVARQAVQLARAAGLAEGKAVQLEEMLRQSGSES
jgi:predicted short-subunit dehydrogenase-like oxidoreductase (DUF2520 family)